MLKNIVVTNIQTPVTVISPKNRYDKTKNRSSYGLSFCLNGQITYSHRGKQYVSTRNTAVLLPKGQTYTLIGNKDGIFPVINFDCNEFECTDIIVFPLQHPESFYQDFLKLRELFLFKDKQLEIFITFYNILNRIVREQSPQNDSFLLALKYIECNFSSPTLSNSLIAQNAHISEVYLRKLFADKYNTSPKQFILDIRIQKAKQLLTDSPYSVSGIAEKCGFSSLYTFSRCFKERTGISPTEYAKMNRVYEI